MSPGVSPQLTSSLSLFTAGGSTLPAGLCDGFTQQAFLVMPVCIPTGHSGTKGSVPRTPQPARTQGSMVPQKEVTRRAELGQRWSSMVLGEPPSPSWLGRSWGLSDVREPAYTWGLWRGHTTVDFHCVTQSPRLVLKFAGPGSPSPERALRPAEPLLTRNYPSSQLQARLSFCNSSFR